jgi:cobalt/nickel transport system ATP-binding protein
MIRARGLRYSYPNGRPALLGVDLDVERGERVALIGPNGAGKTTFMLHLNGLLTGRGALTVAGLDAGRDVRALRARVGLVFQDPDDQLFMTSVAEDVAFGPLNLGLGRAEAGERVHEALRAVRMEHAAARAPYELSMGEKRRAAIATVLAMRPHLLVLDEPSASLDPRGRRELVEVLDGLDSTMLLVTHDLPLAAELCQRAVILDDGVIAADGPIADVLGDEELLAAHALELPVGFDLGRVARRATRRPPATASGPAARRAASPS